MSDIQTPGNGASNRLLKAVVIGLGVLIVIAFGALVVGMVTRMGGHATPAPQAEPAAAFALPPGAKIVEMQSQPGRLILRLRTAEGEEVDILDTDDGHLVSRVRTIK